MPTKKSTSLAMIFVAWATGNMAAPQVCSHRSKNLLRIFNLIRLLFPRFSRNATPFATGRFTAHFCLYVLFNIVLLITRFLLIRRNMAKKAAALTAQGASVVDGNEKITHKRAFDDITDMEMSTFAMCTGFGKGEKSVM